MKTSPPLLWLPRGVDNSAGGQVWIPAGRWGELQDHMLHLSYGTGTQFLVLQEEVGGVWQGAAVPLPGDFRSGAHRGRFHALDGQLYVSGMTGWGTYTPDDGCLHRVRWTGGEMLVPIACGVRENGLLLTFSSTVDATTAADAGRHFAQCWNYRTSAAYGSPELSLRHPGKPGHDVLAITAARVTGGGRQVFLEIPQQQPADQVHVLVSPRPGVERELFLTIHTLGPAYTEYPGYRVIPKELWAGREAPATTVRPSPYASGSPGRVLEIQAAAGLQYNTKTLTARAGEPLSLSFSNPDVLPHNWVLLAPGTAEKTGTLADKLVTDPSGYAQHYIPEIPEVLAWTAMVAPGTTATIHFPAPAAPGDYPFLCTFPGRWRVVQGILEVR